MLKLRNPSLKVVKEIVTLSTRELNVAKQKLTGWDFMCCGFKGMVRLSRFTWKSNKICSNLTKAESLGPDRCRVSKNQWQHFSLFLFKPLPGKISIEIINLFDEKSPVREIREFKMITDLISIPYCPADKSLRCISRSKVWLICRRIR